MCLNKTNHHQILHSEISFELWIRYILCDSAIHQQNDWCINKINVNKISVVSFPFANWHMVSMFFYIVRWSLLFTYKKNQN